MCKIIGVYPPKKSNQAPQITGKSVVGRRQRLSRHVFSGAKFVQFEDWIDSTVDVLEPNKHW